MFDSVWERKGSDAMSKNLYILTISLMTGLGIFISFLVATFTLHADIGWIGAIVVLVLGIAGVILAYTSDIPLVSFVGYMLIVVPYGALLGPFINTIVGPVAKTYLGIPVNADIATAFLVTTAYVVIFGLIGTVIPDSLEGWSRWLLAGLTVGIVGYLVIPVAGFFGLNVPHALGIWDWAIVILFAFIIMRDLNRAMRTPYTLDNAIDVSIAIYLDWFNVFIRLALLLSGRSKKD
jgi:FtsH-binding integral membrane protein